MTAFNKQALRKTAEKAQEHGVFNIDIHSETVLALLDELEAKDSRIGELEVIATDYGIKFQKSQDALKHQSLLHKSQMEAAEKRIAELEALARGVKQFSEFQICHYGATEDYAKGYIDCQNNYNKVLFATAGKGE
ncbi:ead/Ea22-like family protein [Escherichia coli]|uniref:ead/Ea22-like family protein n=1 Tax=Escherichia coli TaxID=562 RepID=UPI0011CAD66D|nr:ead/Ea22-like family protein [Escherichia coli]TXP96219.1 ead/Ea22-like family protein [Escherichia coli]TXQ01639.1 ead/Ea22-like family protein [Escherichia coli]